MTERQQRASLTEPMLGRIDNPLAPHVEPETSAHVETGQVVSSAVLPNGTVVEQYA